MYAPKPFPGRDAQCGCRELAEGERAALTHAEHSKYVGLILGALAFGIAFGIVCTCWPVSGWLR